MSIKYLFLLLMILPLVTGAVIQSDLQVLKSSRQGNVIVVCQNNLQKCSDSAIGNITIFYPDSTVLINNKNLTFTPNYFYYPLNANQTNITGKYNAVGFFNDGGNIAPFAFDFYITRTGNMQTTSQGINSIAYLFLMIALTFIFGIMAFKFIQDDTFWVMGVFFFAMAFSLLVYNVWLAYEYKVSYLSEDGSMNQTIFVILLIILFAGFISMVVLLLTKWKKIISFIKSAIKEEKDDDDGWDNNNFDSFNK